MINLEGFLKGEIAYVVDRENIFDFLNILEANSDVVWLSGDKPTKYNPSEYIWDINDDVLTLGLCRRSHGWIGIGFNEMWWFKSNNYKVEVF